MARDIKSDMVKRRKRLDARRPKPDPLYDPYVAKTRCLCGKMVVFTKVEDDNRISGVCDKCNATTILTLNKNNQWVKL